MQALWGLGDGLRVKLACWFHDDSTLNRRLFTAARGHLDGAADELIGLWQFNLQGGVGEGELV